VVYRFDLESISWESQLVRMPFTGPPKEEVVAVATDLIARFGLQAHDEALHLEEVAAMLRSVRNRALYRDVASEIEKSITEARVRLKATPESEAVEPR
jgi:hypothetical protein